MVCHLVCHLLNHEKESEMKKGWLALVVCLVCPFIIGGTASGGEVKWNIVMATGSVGGTASVLGPALTERIKSEYPDAVIDMPPGGTTTNILRVGTGEIEVGWATLTTAKAGYEGTPPPKEFATPLVDLRGVANVWDQQFQFVVPKSFAANSVDEMFEKKMPIRVVPGGPRGNFGVLALEQLLGAMYGVTLKDIESWGGKVIYAEFTEAVAMMQDGHIDLFCPLTASPNSTMMELANTIDVKFLPMSEKSIKVMHQFGYEPTVLKKGTYKDVNEDVPSISAPFGIIANNNVSSDLIYELTRILCENKPHLENAHVIAKDFNPENAMNGLGAPIHPGAEKYYREKGWMK